MRHTKLDGLMTPAERIARVAASAYDAATAPATAPSGTIAVSNADGTKTIIGPQAGAGEGAPGGQAIATHVGDTTPPPVPSGIKAWSGDGCLHVSWDGTLEDTIPADFLCVNILADGMQVSQLRRPGSVTIGGWSAGDVVSVTAASEDDACLADGTPAHNVSAACDAISVTIAEINEATVTQLKVLSNSITSEVKARAKADGTVSELGSKMEQAVDGINVSLDRLSATEKQIHSWFGFGSDASGNPKLSMGSSSSPIVGEYTNSGTSYKSRSGATLLALDAATSTTSADHMVAKDISIGRWQWVPTAGGTHLTLMWVGG